MVLLKNAADLLAKTGAKVKLSAEGTSDPDGDELVYNWWQYQEVGSYDGDVELLNPGEIQASFIVPEDAGIGETIHIICEVKDSGSPQLTRYQRVIITID